MKKFGFEAKYAAAIEAVASNGGQIAPPVMGATAFIIAEFLEVPYQDVMVAAIIPAALYFLVLFFRSMRSRRGTACPDCPSRNCHRR